ncbi:MAG: DapH/DapD/GlmU-related protein, partial [Ilumatobacteraceae bacterium]
MRDRLVGITYRMSGPVVRRAWAAACRVGAIGPNSAAGKRFGSFGDRSIICFPFNTIFNERYIHVGSGTMFGPQVTLSAGMVPGQQCLADPVVRIGDRCLIGKGSSIIGHFGIEIGNDVWTGPHVYITDQN